MTETHSQAHSLSHWRTSTYRLSIFRLWDQVKVVGKNICREKRNRRQRRSCWYCCCCCGPLWILIHPAAHSLSCYPTCGSQLKLKIKGPLVSEMPSQTHHHCYIVRGKNQQDTWPLTVEQSVCTTVQLPDKSNLYRCPVCVIWRHPEVRLDTAANWTPALLQLRPCKWQQWSLEPVSYLYDLVWLQYSMDACCNVYQAPCLLPTNFL